MRSRLAACLVLSVALAGAQTGGIGGVVRDSAHQAVVGASVSLTADGNLVSSVHTGATGDYRFPALPPGTYQLRAEKPGAGAAVFGPFQLADIESKSVDITLLSPNAQAPPFQAPPFQAPPFQAPPFQAPPFQAPPFDDKPDFVVAGVTESTYQGGHGSDTVLRSAASLAKATASLTQGKPEKADAAERAGNPIEAAREYQQAAESNPSEPNLFNWGAELLIHRAAAQAIEVFNTGNGLFPQSTRMLLGLAAAWYARGAYDQAAKCFFAACDVNPEDAAPYLFLAQVQAPVICDSSGYRERFARFARIHPDSALANYDYAAALWKQRKGPEDLETPLQVQTLVEKAIRLDPQLGAAHLLLGIVRYERNDFPGALACFEKAVEVNPDLEEAHYRLSQAYKKAGKPEKARQELELYRHLSKKSADDFERERNAVPQFAITLRNLPAQ